MKTAFSYAVLAVLGGTALPGHAQSSVTIYGLLDVGLTYISNQGGHSNLRPDWSVGAAYMYMKGNEVLNNNHAHQISAVLDHALSKRTSVYLMSVYQRTNAGAQALINGINDPNGSASGPSQLIVRVGLHTLF